MFLIELTILQPLVPTVAKWLPTGAAISLTTPVQAPGTNLAPALAVVLVGWATVVALIASRFTLNRELR